MGLDAYIYCDCFEKGRLREPPPAGVTLHIEPDGSLGSTNADDSLDAAMAMDHWQQERACEHEAGVLLHCRLGNMALVSLLSAELEPHAEQFPILLSRVLYSGNHAGDFLPVKEVPALQQELELLRNFQSNSSTRSLGPKTSDVDMFISDFQEQMSKLATASLLVCKPIAF